MIDEKKLQSPLPQSHDLMALKKKEVNAGRDGKLSTQISDFSDHLRISGSQNSLTKYRSMLIEGETLLRAITLLMSAIS